MTRKNRFPTAVVALLVGGLLVAGLYVLISMRFSSGDIFPAYSSYRVGPKGTKMLYRALSNLPEKQIEQQVKPPKPDDLGRGTTVLLLGMDPSSLFGEIEEEWLDFIKTGGRGVAALNAVPPADLSLEELVTWDEHFLCSEELGVGIQKTNTTQSAAGTAMLETTGEALTWYGAYSFCDLDEAAWTVLARRDGEPVMIERSWGEGSIVLLSDSYLFSNEAMVVDRHTELLSQLIGESQRIVFDETHLGVVSQEGVMMIAYRHRFHGFMIALLLLAGLFIWQRMSSLLPRNTTAHRADNPRNSWSGTHQGFTNLLRRHVPKKQLLIMAANEWLATYENDPSMQAKRTKFKSALDTYKLMGEVKDPAATYNNLTQMLNERK
ncbi:MAG: hypothetical protein JXR40_11630 [Pontiellaceae bacterium]|nr:hypothetical protein [Pontiellaceae bacterium]